jgi:hypothetical protein
VYCRIGRGVLDSRSRAQPRGFLHFRWPAIWRRGFDVRDIDESRAIEAIRGFLDSPAARQRAVTAEWLAGRLGLPLAICEHALGRLVAIHAVRRVYRGRTPPLYLRSTSIGRNLRAHLIIALLVAAVLAAVAFVALNSRFVFVGAEALFIGLIIAFAWLDAELRDSRPPRPPG